GLASRSVAQRTRQSHGIPHCLRASLPKSFCHLDRQNAIRLGGTSIDHTRSGAGGAVVDLEAYATELFNIPQALLGNTFSQVVLGTKGGSPGIRHNKGFREQAVYLMGRRRFERVPPGCAVLIGTHRGRGQRWPSW